MSVGILCGLASALCQCIAYLYSKIYIHKNGNPFQLLLASHLLIGLGAGVCLGGLLLEQDLPPFADYWRPLAEVCLTNIVGQLGFFLAVSRTEASRLAPLLGLKIIFIAAFGILFMRQHLLPLQWIAIVLCFGGAMLSNWSGKRIPSSGLWWLLSAVVMYSLTDIGIKILIDSMKHAVGENIAAVFIAISLVYFCLGVFSLLLILITRTVKLSQLKPALPFAGWWFGTMLLLFTCFSLIGPLLGNIVQSGRGIIAVILGAVLAGLGWTKYEEKLSRRVLFWRLAAAFMITGAIIMFILAKE